MTRASFAVTTPRSTALRALNYTPEIERFRSPGRRRRAYRLGDLVGKAGAGYGQVFTRIDCDPEHGVELLSQSDMFGSEPSGRVIRRDSMPDPDRHLIAEWQVLIAAAGTLGDTELYGRSIVADRRLAGKYVGPDAMVLEFAEASSDMSLYAYTVLCSEFGVRAVRSTSYGTKVLRLRGDLLSELPIPQANDRTQKRVAKLTRLAVKARERYLSELQRARSLLYQVPEIQEAMALCSRRKARCLAWDGALPTLTAWTYASTGSALAFLRAQWRGCLRDVLVEDGLFNGPRFARIPCRAPHGVDFLSQRDVFLVRPVPRRIAVPDIDDGLLFVDDGALLIASHGQLNEGSLFGRIEPAAHGESRSAITQDILRVLVRRDARNIAYAWLSTRLGQRLLQSTAIGTSIPMMRLDLVADLPFPDLDDAIRTAVESCVEASIHARVEAHDAESEAIRIVEQEVIPEWLG